MACIRCMSVINENEQYYVTDDMGCEINLVIERSLSYQVVVNGMICSQCFDFLIQEMSSGSILANENCELQHRRDSNVCVRCRTSLFRKRSHFIPDGAERQYIAETIAPRECKRSLNLTRFHSIPEGPERTAISASIYPREIPPGGRVCYACWVAARRNVARATRIEEEQHTPGPSNLHQDAVCAWCRISLHRRQTHVASGNVRDVVAARIHPIEMPEHALLCSNCWTCAQDNIQVKQEVVQPLDIQTSSGTITLDEFTHTTHTSTHCFVPACNNEERNRVPEYLRKIILKSHKVFVTENARVCNEHKLLHNWDFLDQHHFSNTFTKNEIESMLRLSIQDD